MVKKCESQLKHHVVKVKREGAEIKIKVKREGAEIKIKR